MRSHWPTAISTEPPCTQLTPSSANEHVENADTRGVEIAQNEPLPIDPLENEIGAERKLDYQLAYPGLHGSMDYKLCGLIAIEAGRSPLTMKGRRTCDRKRHDRLFSSTH